MAQHDIPESRANFSQKKRVWAHTKLGLNFPIGRLYRNIKYDKFAERISHDSAVFLAGVLEYITREVLEGAGIQCKASKKTKKSKLIKPHHISLALRTDEELNELIGDKTVVPMGGVIPFIHPYIKRSKGKKRQSLISHTQKTQITKQVEVSEDAEDAKVDSV